MVFFEDGLVVVLPELLAGIFAGYPLKNFLSAWMLVLKFREIVHVLVHDDPEIGGLVVRCHIACGEDLRHGDVGVVGGWWRCRRWCRW